jgi:hypothetical protein
MKPAFSYLLSIVVLLCMAWGCEEPAVYKPKPLPPALVPNPKTPPAVECSGSITTTPCNGMHGDLIARINIWTITSPLNRWATTTCQLIDSTVTELYLETQQVFRYDQQGRIAGETWITTRIDADKRAITTDTAVLSYTYFPDHVIRTRRGTYYGKPLVEGNEVRTELNENGFTKGTPGYRPTFDKDGYLISAVTSYSGPFVVKNGNIILSSASALEGPGEIRGTNIYDTTRANIPNPYQFEGRGSRNLRIREITSVGGPGTVPFVTAAVQTYQYQFDRQGFVTQRIKFGRSNNLRAWPYVVNTTVTEYFYDCR